MPSFQGVADREAAVDDLLGGVYAASSKGPHASRIRTVQTMIRNWGLEPWPPTPSTWTALGASLKRGRYRSPRNYLDAYRTEAERRGFGSDAWVRRAVADFSRSCARGMGGLGPVPPIAVLPLGQAAGSPRTRNSRRSGGPQEFHPGRYLVAHSRG